MDLPIWTSNAPLLLLFTPGLRSTQQMAGYAQKRKDLTPSPSFSDEKTRVFPRPCPPPSSCKKDPMVDWKHRHLFFFSLVASSITRVTFPNRDTTRRRRRHTSLALFLLRRPPLHPCLWAAEQGGKGEVMDGSATKHKTHSQKKEEEEEEEEGRGVCFF